MASACSLKKTAIFYSVYINPKVNWKRFIRRQMNDLRASALFEEVDLYIDITNHAKVEGVTDFIQTLAPNGTKILEHAENAFEYWSIKRLWETCTSLENEYDTVGYLHTKSMSYSKPWRNVTEKFLTHTFAKNWRKALDILRREKDVDVCGLFPNRCDNGVMVWYNFWWAKTSYIRTVETPKRTNDRYYYEHWLSLSQKETANAHSILVNDRRYYGPEDAMKFMKLCRSLGKKRWHLEHRIFSLLGMRKKSNVTRRKTILLSEGVSPTIIKDIVAG